MRHAARPWQKDAPVSVDFIIGQSCSLTRKIEAPVQCSHACYSSGPWRKEEIFRSYNS